ncbi:hypothetical protein BGW36DRAFT_419945 [Talaromyces proteolyticus]|uniref:Ketoreductase domain-containing protein n=1 Tax=Talaromyces proteolyticus TaxID=1131652 RepID=A0AAD4KGF1_9EURO|nr:uncharacterized protein BGW36DRAFT_419945 [Talaromyces proteolyticus]KAH8691529.1 hypothetical protein BGW36DRAFT_419945 [Talaromyces proteolyticus]
MSKVWFVTGSSRGLGLAIVEAILNSGGSVIATARNAKQLQHLVDKHGTEKVLPLSLDVTQYNHALEAVRLGVEKFHRIDVVVNNAGYADVASIEDITIESFRAQFETNYMGVVYVTKAILPVLRAQGNGHIIQVSSVGGRMASAGLGAYQSAKWAVGGFSSVLAKEVGPLGIRVTVLEPGGMRTDWSGTSMEVAPVSEAYRQTVGAVSEYVRSKADSWPTDPVKVADVILQVAEIDEPPLRLLIGAETLQYAAQVTETLAAEDKKWSYLTIAASGDK